MKSLLTPRLHHGPSSWVLWACSSTSLWTPLMGSRPGGQTAAQLWESSSTTAAMLSPPVRHCSSHNRTQTIILFCFLYIYIWKISCISRSEALSFHFLCFVFLPSVFVAVGTCISCGIGLYANWIFFCGFIGMFMFFCAHWQTYVSGTLRFGL